LTHNETMNWKYLDPGRYTEDVILHAGEGLCKTPGTTGEVEFWRCGITVENGDGCRIQDITFRQAPHSAICVNGGQDITIRSCGFYACGIRQGVVTVWLGPHTRNCEVSECRFDTLWTIGENGRNLSHVHSIAIMTAEEDCLEHKLLNNRIDCYGYGIQCGATGTCTTEGRHLIRGNVIAHPFSDGIHIKSAKCSILENTVRGARSKSMSARAGFESRFLHNRMEDGHLGLILRGRGHEAAHNHFVRIRSEALCLMPAKENGDGFAAENIDNHHNTFLDCGGAAAGEPKGHWTPYD